MNATPYPDTPSTEADAPLSGLMSRGQIHFRFWLWTVLGTLTGCFVLLVIQSVVSTIDNESLRKSPQIFFFLFLIFNFCVFIFYTALHPYEQHITFPMTFPRRFIAIAGILNALAILFMSHRLYASLPFGTQLHTATYWNALADSIILSPLLVIFIGLMMILGQIQKYRSRLAALSSETPTAV